MKRFDAKTAIVAIFIASFALRFLLVFPYGHLLGEDTYFHKDMVNFFINNGGLAQFNIGQWEAGHQYFLSQSPKILSYPFGFHLMLYPFVNIFGDMAYRFFSVFFSSLIPIFIYLFFNEYTNRPDLALMASVFYLVPDVIAHSILLLPQSVGMVFLPLTLWLYLRTRLGGILAGLIFFVHPLSGVVTTISMVSLGLWRHDGRKIRDVTAVSIVIIMAYIVMITINSSSAPSTFNFHLPEFVVYDINKYLSAFSITLLFPLGILSLKERKGWYFVLMSAMLGATSFIKISNLPPERFFAFLAMFLACTSVYMLDRLASRNLRAATAGMILIFSLSVCTDVFGNIGPAYVEVASWEHLNENTVYDTMVWGGERYPQIYITERKIQLFPNSFKAMYLSPETHIVGDPRFVQARNSDMTNVIYDNFFPTMSFNWD